MKVFGWIWVIIGMVLMYIAGFQDLQVLAIITLIQGIIITAPKEGS